MELNRTNILSITEANQNFSKACRMAERSGEIYIFKNNKPKYKLVHLEQDTGIEMTDEEKIDFVSHRILERYRAGFEELAK